MARFYCLSGHETVSVKQLRLEDDEEENEDDDDDDKIESDEKIA